MNWIVKFQLDTWNKQTSNTWIGRHRWGTLQASQAYIELPSQHLSPLDGCRPAWSSVPWRNQPLDRSWSLASTSLQLSDTSEMGFSILSNFGLKLKSNWHPCGALHIIMFPVWLWNILVISAEQHYCSQGTPTESTCPTDVANGEVLCQQSFPASDSGQESPTARQRQAMQQLSMLRLWNRCCVIRSKPKALNRSEFSWSTQREKGNA